MSKSILLVVCLLSLFSAAGHAQNEPVLAKIQRTGVLTAGVWKDLKPFAYVDENGERAGYSVDLTRVIQSLLQKALEKDVRIEWVEIDSQNRFDRILNREIDVDCGPNTFTWERERVVDFSVSTFVDGAQFLAHESLRLEDAASLTGKKVGIEKGATTEQVVDLLNLDTDVVLVSSVGEGLDKLQKREIDVYADHGSILSAYRRDAKNPLRWQIVPEQPVTREAYACIVPENDSAWRDFVSYSIVRALQGYLLGDPEFTAMYESWFGPAGVSPFPREVLEAHFNSVVNTRAGIPRSSY